MPEINDKLSLKNKNLSVLLREIENDLMEYVNQGQDQLTKNRRKKKVIVALDSLAAKLQGGMQSCPKGTVWDQATRTCKPIS